ncbi:hypothetical protein [Halostella salina]|uniref:hypothetical protein n=1 Tax=Halostella salina TaxID=1547897 RepID=UPI0013CE78F8|nr:hypothetical protein [Halostella salina]
MSDATAEPGESDAPDDRAGPLATLDHRMATFRADDRQRRIGLAVALVVGVGVAWLHWLGLVVAGALVGLTCRSLPRALAAGIGVGVVVLATFVLLSPTLAAGELLALGQPAYVAVGSALALPLLGSLTRGVV